MAYKSVRLLVEAIHSEMDLLRKSVMACEIPPEKSVDIYDAMGTLRGLFDELGVKADRPTLEDVVKLSPSDYVATMKPLVGNYHRQLLTADLLTACLCEDLQATGVMLVLIGEDKTIVRASHHPDHPEVGLAIEAMVEVLDSGTRQVVSEGVAEAEKQLGIENEPIDQPSDKPLRVRYADAIQQDDFERNYKAEFVIDCNGIVIKDRYGEAGRKATEEEIDSCILVKDPGSGVGYEDEL